MVFKELFQHPITQWVVAIVIIISITTLLVTYLYITRYAISKANSDDILKILDREGLLEDIKDFDGKIITQKFTEEYIIEKLKIYKEMKRRKFILHLLIVVLVFIIIESLIFVDYLMKEPVSKTEKKEVRQNHKPSLLEKSLPDYKIDGDTIIVQLKNYKIQNIGELELSFKNVGDERCLGTGSNPIEKDNTITLQCNFGEELSFDKYNVSVLYNKRKEIIADLGFIKIGGKE